MATPARPEDPVLVSARREALVVLGMWLTALLWTVGYGAMFGYRPDAEPVLVMGIPSWVVWGIFVPWTICTCVSSLLATYFIRDADLGDDPDEKRSDLEAAREVGDA